MKSFQRLAILSVLLCSAASSRAQQAPGTAEDTPAAEPKPAEPKAAEPQAPEPKAAEPQAPEPQAPEPKAAEPQVPEPRRAPGSLEEMVRGQRGERWERERSLLRQSLEEAGLGGKELQEAVVTFAQEQDSSREMLRAASARCWDALRNPDFKDAELSTLLKGYRDAAAAAQAGRDKALAALDAKVRFSKSPRLELLLRLKGLLGGEAWLAGDALSEAESFDLRVLFPAAPDATR